MRPKQYARTNDRRDRGQELQYIGGVHSGRAKPSSVRRSVCPQRRRGLGIRVSNVGRLNLVYRASKRADLADGRGEIDRPVGAWSSVSLLARSGPRPHLSLPAHAAGRYQYRPRTFKTVSIGVKACVDRLTVLQPPVRGESSLTMITILRTPLTNPRLIPRSGPARLTPCARAVVRYPLPRRHAVSLKSNETAP